MRCLISVAVLLLMCGPAFAQTYVGDATCGTCHANNPEQGFFETYLNSGHPWKVFNTAGNVPAPDTYPHTPLPPLPVVNATQLMWSDVHYIIGNFYWKARFIDDRGYIFTGQASETTQWNLLTEEWVPYHAGEVDKPFDCGKCHTTGYDPAGNQNGWPGLIGTWEQEGVRCEACHGPGSDHVGNPTGVAPPGGKACADCHFRDAQFRMPWSGGFMRHHQQSEDFSHSAHAGTLTCNSCHNPHRSVVYDDGGTTTTCSQCHPGNSANGFYLVDGMESVACKDCHMPFMGKSGQNFNAFKGDIRGHLFQIMTTETMAADNVTELDMDGKLYWNTDMNGDGFATLDYACMGCHEEIGDPITIMAASAYADNIHVNHPSPVQLAWFNLVPQDGAIKVAWETSMESNHLGFNLLRADEADRQFEKLNNGLIDEPTGPGRRYEYIDNTVENRGTYVYKLEAVDTFGGVEAFDLGVVQAGLAPQQLVLHQNTPNPFNPSTSISFDLPRPANVSLRIYDSQGRAVRTLVDEMLPRSTHSLVWDGTDDRGASLASGTYLYRLDTGERTLTRKLVLVR